MKVTLTSSDGLIFDQYVVDEDTLERLTGGRELPDIARWLKGPTTPLINVVDLD